MREAYHAFEERYKQLRRQYRRGLLKLIATGFGEACIAANYAKHYLDPAANIFPGHSSNMKKT